MDRDRAARSTRRTRRALLASTGALAAALAGCADTPGRPAAERSTDSPAGSPTDTPTATRTDTPTDPALAWALSVEAAVTDVDAAGGTAYVGTEGGVHAVDADGTARWSVGTDHPVRSVTATADHVFAVVGTAELASGHELIAFAAADGAERWRRSPTSWWLELLGVRGGTAFLATADDAVGPDGQTLYALAAADGTDRWTAEIGDPYGGLVTDDAVYVPSYGRFYAFDRDGGRRWTREVGYNANSLSAVGDAVAFSAETDAGRYVGLGLSAADGTTRWTVDDRFVNSTLAGDGVVYVGGERVAALDPATGEARWRDETGGSLYDAPLADGTIYTGGREVRALAAADGAERWTFAPELYLLDAVAALDGTVYVHASESEDDRNRHVAALDPADGRERWRFGAEAELADPAVAGGRLVAGDEWGNVYGFV